MSSNRPAGPVRSSPANTVVTVLLFVLLFVTEAIGSFLVAVFLAASTSTAPTSAYVLILAGMAFGLLLSIVGAAVSAGRGRPMWWWPLVGIIVVVLGILVGAAAARTGG
jgi:hypothetical protein